MVKKIDSAFIQIETDYDYVAGQMNEKAARFLLDFYAASGPIRDAMVDISRELELTAKELARAQVEEDTGNLVKGIQSNIRGTAIELRSTAYKLPRSGKNILKGYDKSGNPVYDKIGQDIKYTQTYASYKSVDKSDINSNAKNNAINLRGGYDKKWSQDVHDSITSDNSNWNGKYLYAGKRRRTAASLYGVHHNKRGAEKVAYWTIRPQGVNSPTGFTGGHNSLQRYHINRYKRTQNLEYYGGHIEFGHKTRNGGGIGFVQARPYLRPALRIVSNASRGVFAETLKSMLLGIGASFDGYKTPGLYFGRKTVSAELNDAGRPINFGSGSSLSHQKVHEIGSALNFARLSNDRYSVRHGNGMWNNILRNDMNWGRNQREINYAKYGYMGKNLHDPDKLKTHRHYGEGYVSQIKRYGHGTKERPWGRHTRSAPKNYMYVLHTSRSGKSSWRKQRGHPPRLKKPKNKTKKVRKHKEQAEAEVRGELWHKRASRAYTKMDKQIHGPTRKRDLPSNRLGKDKTKLTQPHDFDVKSNPDRVLKPKDSHKAYMKESEYAEWEKRYNAYWDTLVAKSRKHNLPFFDPLAELLDNED